MMIKTIAAVAVLLAGALFAGVSVFFKYLPPYMELLPQHSSEINAVNIAIENLVDEYAALGPFFTRSHSALQFIVSNGLDHEFRSRLDHLVDPESDSALRSIAADEWTVASNNRFKGSSLRYKVPENSGVGRNPKQYFGYADISSGKRLFFRFVEARPAREVFSTLLWLSGAPGCSSLLSLFYELDALRIHPELRPKAVECVSDKNANVLLVDQPVNVGYSWSETKGFSGIEHTGFSWSENEHIDDIATAVPELYVFLELFFSEFPKYAEPGLQIASESYGGDYAIGVTSEMRQHEAVSFNISAMLIGGRENSPLIPPLCGHNRWRPVSPYCIRC